MVLLRIAVAVGGLTFLATGLGVLFSDRCRSVTWGSRGDTRAGNFTAVCHDSVVAGGMSQGVAGIIAIAAGLAIVTMVMVPSLVPSVRRRRASRS
jgi:hypothetical protein